MREVAALPAPVGPAAGQPAEDLPGVGLLAERGARRPGTLRCSHSGTPASATRSDLQRHAGPAEVLLRQDVDRHLRPALRGQQVLHLEDDRAVRVDDPRGPRHERDRRERVLARDGVTTGNLHVRLARLSVKRAK